MVRDQIRDKLAYAFEDLGEQSVKNIARPVRVYALRSEAAAELPAPMTPPTPPVSQPVVAPRLSIVVLPFTNLSNDPEQQYFADGITEDLTTDLSRLPDMFVISRNTAFTYQDKRVDTKQIGREKPKVSRSKGPPAYRSPGRTLRRPEPLRRAFSGTEGLNPSSSSGESNELRNRGVAEIHHSTPRYQQFESISLQR
jgi:hypothetical protein